MNACNKILPDTCDSIWLRRECFWVLLHWVLQHSTNFHCTFYQILNIEHTSRVSVCQVVIIFMFVCENTRDYTSSMCEDSFSTDGEMCDTLVNF